MKKEFTVFAALIFIIIIAVNCTYSKVAVAPLPPPNTCDTTNMSYSNDIVPILSFYCYSCHSGDAFNGGGIHLDIYLGVYNKVVAEKSLIPAIQQDSTVLPMPYQSPKIPACDINKIIAWTNQGAQDN